MMKIDTSNGNGGKDEPDVFADGFMTVAQAAEFLSLSPSKLYQLIESGRLLATKIDRNIRVPRRALVDFATAHLKGSR